MDTELNMGSTPDTGTQQQTDLTQAPQVENHDSAIKYLFTENRKLRAMIEEDREKDKKNEERLSKVEAFIGKVGQAFSGFFRKKGVNIAEENEAVNEKATEEGYLEQRPDGTGWDEYVERYKTNLESQNLPPEEIVRRMATLENAAPFEGGVNMAPENQSSAPEGEISFEEYTQYRPSMNDYAKEKIQEAGGVSPEVASEVAATRQRVQDSEARMERAEVEPSGLQRTVAEAGQKLRQTFQSEGVNIAPENQIDKVEKTAGQLYDEAEARGESGIPYINLAEAGKQDNLQQQTQPQQPEVASAAA
ncbi:MAG: hypothetical protein WCY37_00585 [Candidatus Dojkabacteria bacterium]